MKIHDSVKTGICAGQMWRISDGVLALKLPQEKDTKDARDWLAKHRDVGAVYFNKAGGVVAQQWFLPLPQFRGLLRFAR